MSDKSKLGFNINPKNYDELNSTDNLITSGSDSGWLGKKLQGDNNSTIDLSKINPLFDKELYEKYRPGVNTNDGSVNQDIWGYKCFNSPVSFRNGIYGDTYSIHSIDTYEGDPLNNTKKNGIIIQPYNKQAVSLNNIDNTFRICNEKRSEQKDDKDLIYIDTRETHIQHSYTGKENQHDVEDVNLYEILKNTYIDGANTENISHTQSNVFPGSGEYSISFIQNTFDHCTIYSSNSTHRENAVTYNGINTFSNKKIDKQIGTFPYITTYNYKDFVNITSSIYYTNNIGTDEEPKHNYNISRITIGTECGNDPVIEKEITANSNCIRMYSADGTHGNSGYTNDNISSIITTPKTINLSSTGTDNNYTSLFIITPDSLDVSLYNDGIHTKTFRHDGKYLIQTPYGQLYSQSIMSGPVTDIIYNFNDINDINDTQTTNSNAFGFLLRSSMSDERQPIPDTVGALRIGCDITYTGPGVDLNYKVIGTSITPLSLSTAAIQLNTVHLDDKFKDYNYVWPCAKIVPGSGTFGDGIDALPTDDIKFVSLNQRDSSHIICDYLTVKNAIKCSNILGSGLAYINTVNNVATDVLTVSNENLILPRGNKEVTIGSSDNQLNEIYANRLKGTADKAMNDYCGNDIIATYVNKLNNYKNDIQSCNAIIGSGERLFFFNEPCIENSIESPEDIPKPYISMGASYEDNGVTSKNVFSWTNKDNSVTRKCIISSKYDYDADRSTAYFCVYPEKAQGGDIADIGIAGAPWSNIWCKRLLCDEVRGSQFPTIVGSTDGTSVGNIRLLCIKAPTVSQTLTRTIEPGEEFEYPVTLSDNRPINPYTIKCTIHVAKFKVTDNSNQSIGIDPGAQVTGKWVALSSTYINANSANISLCFPVLAMRVE